MSVEKFILSCKKCEEPLIYCLVDHNLQDKKKVIVKCGLCGGESFPKVISGKTVFGSLTEFETKNPKVTFDDVSYVDSDLPVWTIHTKKKTN